MAPPSSLSSFLPLSLFLPTGNRSPIPHPVSFSLQGLFFDNSPFFWHSQHMPERSNPPEIKPLKLTPEPKQSKPRPIIKAFEQHGTPTTPEITQALTSAAQEKTDQRRTQELAQKYKEELEPVNLPSQIPSPMGNLSGIMSPVTHIAGERQKAATRRQQIRSKRQAKRF